MAVRTVLFGQPDTPGPTEWDNLVTRDPDGHVLQTWAWGDLKADFGWRPFRMALQTEEGYVAGAQVLYRPIGPLTAGYIAKGPFFLDRNPATSAALWESIHSFSRKQSAISLKVEPPWRDCNAPSTSFLADAGFAPDGECVQPRRTIIVDLDADEETILARMKSKWRYNIRLSSRKGVVVRQVGHEGLETFYDLLRVTSRRDGFGIHSRAYYRRALDLFEPLGRATLLMAYLGDEPLAGIMPFACNGQAFYMYGASSDKHRNTMPNHLLQWQAMRWARDMGCTTYDLWGIPDVDPDSPSQDLTGVGRFKQGFGGEIVRFAGAYDRTYRPLLNWAATVGRTALRKIGPRTG